MIRLLGLLLLVFMLVRPAAAHELRPAYLELAEGAPGQFSVLWKVPAAGDRRLSLYV
ncbi:MAG: HupE/UreJ family protein, partial [Aestuariivirga sp.]|nr:HupE/UreJ family protein [Aestuariivirga sp.]